MIGFEPPLHPRAPKDAKRSLIKYRLTKFNGGKDPYGEHPSVGSYSYGNRTPTCDCSGFVAWALGFDRFQPKDRFPSYGGWVNTDSMISDAKRSGSFFELLTAPEWGCLVVSPSKYKRVDGRRKRVKVGHVGMVVGPLPAEWGDNWDDLRVVHCSSSNSRRGGAIQETSGSGFRGRGVFLRYLRAAPCGG